ncbi:MAG TPA: LptF/LptG family permease [Bacteroidia bacterium]|nr:LptF/LptG family permease [Bacteroidia bacterium]
MPIFRMIDILTRNPVIRWSQQLWRKAAARFSGSQLGLGREGLVLKLFAGASLVGLAALFVGTLIDYRDGSAALQEPDADGMPGAFPSIVPLAFQGIALCLAFVAFVASLWFGRRASPARRRLLIVATLSLVSLAALAAWLPTDVIATRAAIMGKAPAGEMPSIPAYMGMLFLVSLLILSIPVAALVYFRLGLMDRYVVNSFLSPFFFCIVSFMAIWMLADLTDHGDAFVGSPLDRIVVFYVVQMPFVVLFVLPIAVLLSGLFALGKMSKSNEFVSMVGAGRSVPRILMPLLVIGLYSSLVGLAFKYQWAPVSVGYKEAIMSSAMREKAARSQNVALAQELWSHRGWMHMNEADRRSWFVGMVPLNLSDEMGDVIVTRLDEDDQPAQMWIAKRAKWVWNSRPPRWILSDVRLYTYGGDRVPRIETFPTLEIDDWSETPWKVLSSSQNPAFLGVPGLTMYLNAHRNLDDHSLAPFRTSWWYIFAEPFACLPMILVAAPLGIVYSRRGGMSGVTGAICIVALMYVIREPSVALGQGGRLPPFLAAWSANFLVAAIGLVLLWFRARNRELPKLRTLLTSPFRRRAGTAD